LLSSNKQSVPLSVAAVSRIGQSSRCLSHAGIGRCRWSTTRGGLEEGGQEPGAARREAATRRGMVMRRPAETMAGEQGTRWGQRRGAWQRRGWAEGRVAPAWPSGDMAWPFCSKGARAGRGTRRHARHGSSLPGGWARDLAGPELGCNLAQIVFSYLVRRNSGHAPGHGPGCPGPRSVLGSHNNDQRVCDYSLSRWMDIDKINLQVVDLR
jgi:hypothetical protein